VRVLHHAVPIVALRVPVFDQRALVLLRDDVQQLRQHDAALVLRQLLEPARHAHRVDALRGHGGVEVGRAGDEHGEFPFGVEVSFDLD